MLRLKYLGYLLNDFDKRNGTDSDLEFYFDIVVHRISNHESRCLTYDSIYEYLKKGKL